MASIVTAPDLYIPKQEWHHKIFLAGAIDMGAAVDWQAWVIDQLKPMERIVVFNPRRPNFTADTLDEQIEWELEALEMVDTVFMWFPKDAKAPISFFEAGLYWKSGKLIVGAEDGFYRRRNLEITGSRYSVRIFVTLNEMLGELLLRKGA